MHAGTQPTPSSSVATAAPPLTAPPGPPLSLVFVSAEVAPWSKTGGLGDVCGSLPVALARRGHRVMVVTGRWVMVVTGMVGQGHGVTGRWFMVVTGRWVMVAPAGGSWWSPAWWVVALAGGSWWSPGHTGRWVMGVTGSWWVGHGGHRHGGGQREVGPTDPPRSSWNPTSGKNYRIDLKP